MSSLFFGVLFSINYRGNGQLYADLTAGRLENGVLYMHLPHHAVFGRGSSERKQRYSGSMPGR